MPTDKQIEAGLKPCPFCGGTKIEQHPDEHIMMWCPECYAQGPTVSYGNPKSDGELWNTRAAITAMREVTGEGAGQEPYELIAVLRNEAKLYADKLTPKTGCAARDDGYKPPKPEETYFWKAADRLASMAVEIARKDAALEQAALTLEEMAKVLAGAGRPGCGLIASEAAGQSRQALTRKTGNPT